MPGVHDHISVPPTLFEELVDSQTALVATSRVYYTSGYIQDIRAVADIAHKHGAYLLVDDYQGTGQIPLNVTTLDVDFVVTGTLKWLMGGPGLAFVYIREGLLPTIQPTITGWFGAKSSSIWLIPLIFVRMPHALKWARQQWPQSMLQMPVWISCWKPA